MLNRRLFKTINKVTIGSVLVLILVGSIVRSLGAGMGCPDWPKCFGQYVPPTSHTELPSDYKEVFKAERLAKNERLSRVLSAIGYTDLSYKITNDPNVFVEQDFSTTKAWIEYINRLIGVLIGIFVFANMVTSFSFRKSQVWVPVVGVSIFILTGFQGWIGSLVVSTNLLQGFITFHLMVALLILALLIWQYYQVNGKKKTQSKSIYLISLILFLLFIPQILLGTGVRAIIDEYLFHSTERSLWIKGLDSIFLIHRSYSWIILIGSGAIFYLVRKQSIQTLKWESGLLLGMVMMSMFAGLAMVKFEFPFWLQPIHMILATGIFSVLFYLTLRLRWGNE
jgi:cytochrome c oxidase assembly protein subunit 15